MHAGMMFASSSSSLPHQLKISMSNSKNKKIAHFIGCCLLQLHHYMYAVHLNLNLNVRRVSLSNLNLNPSPAAR